MKRDTLVLIIALACGVAAFSLIFNFLKQAALPQRQFILAKEDLPKGRILKAGDLAVSIPVKNVPQGKYFTQINDLVGMQLEKNIPRGEMIERIAVKKAPEAPPVPAPVRAPVVVVPKARIEKTLPVPPAMRALTLSAQELENVPAVLTPGDYVDILGNVVVSNSQREVRTLLYAVSVLGLHRDSVRKKGAAEVRAEEFWPIESVTLALTPAQIETVLNASKLGKMRLVINSREGSQSAWANVGSIEIIRGVQKERKST